MGFCAELRTDGPPIFHHLHCFTLINAVRETVLRDLPKTQTMMYRTLFPAIISLLLTTVGFSHRLDNEFDRGFYIEIKLIARLCAIVLALAVTVLLALTMPLTESDTLRPWFTIMYYLLILCSASMAALIISTIILIHQTVANIIQVVYPEPQSEVR